MSALKEGEELPRSEISFEAKELAEALWQEARTDRIYSIIELALRDALERGYFEGLFRQTGNWKDEAPNAASESHSDPSV